MPQHHAPSCLRRGCQELPVGGQRILAQAAHAWPPAAAAVAAVVEDVGGDARAGQHGLDRGPVGQALIVAVAHHQRRRFGVRGRHEGGVQDATAAGERGMAHRQG